MSEKKHSEFPYKNLGLRLKTMRERLRKSLSEVSGAVEIDEDTLQSIEQGKVRPDEEILLLLINHFEVKDDEAAKLWDLAGYSKEENTSLNEEPQHNRQIVMVMPVDARIIYTDMAQVTANNFGVVLNFMQTAGPNGQPLGVSRIGMSIEHAYSVLELLQQTLSQHAEKQKPRALPDPEAETGQES